MRCMAIFFFVTVVGLVGGRAGGVIAALLGCLLPPPLPGETISILWRETFPKREVLSISQYMRLLPLVADVQALLVRRTVFLHSILLEISNQQPRLLNSLHLNTAQTLGNATTLCILTAVGSLSLYTSMPRAVVLVCKGTVWAGAEEKHEILSTNDFSKDTKQTKGNEVTCEYSSTCGGSSKVIPFSVAGHDGAIGAWEPADLEEVSRI